MSDDNYMDKDAYIQQLKKEKRQVEETHQRADTAFGNEFEKFLQATLVRSSRRFPGLTEASA